MNQAIKINDLDKEFLHGIFLVCVKFVLELSKNLNNLNVKNFLDDPECLELQSGDLFTVTLIEKIFEDAFSDKCFPTAFIEIFEKSIDLQEQLKHFYEALFCFAHGICVKNKFLKFFSLLWLRFRIKLRNIFKGSTMHELKIPLLYEEIIKDHKKDHKEEKDNNEEVEILDSSSEIKIFPKLNLDDFTEISGHDVVSESSCFENEGKGSEGCPLPGVDDKNSVVDEFNTEEPTKVTKNRGDTEVPEIKSPSIEVPEIKSPSIVVEKDVHELKENDEFSDADEFSDGFGESENLSSIVLEEDNDYENVLQNCKEIQDEERCYENGIVGSLKEYFTSDCSISDRRFVLGFQSFSVSGNWRNGNRYRHSLDDSILDRRLFVKDSVENKRKSSDVEVSETMQERKAVDYVDVTVHHYLITHVDSSDINFQNGTEALQFYRDNRFFGRVIAFDVHDLYLNNIVPMAKVVKRFKIATQGLFRESPYSERIFCFDLLEKFLPKSFSKTEEVAKLLEKARLIFGYSKSASNCLDDLNNLILPKVKSNYPENLIGICRLFKHEFDEIRHYDFIFEVNVNKGKTRICEDPCVFNFQKIMLEPFTIFAIQKFEVREFFGYFRVVAVVEALQPVKQFSKDMAPSK
ncbi:MAG: hypothetical protein LBJ09_02400 [Clostridiales bacterium]|nr:hypothetical protein [Clostridiales bacterium]